MTFEIRPAADGDAGAMHRVRSSVRENRLSNPARISEACYLPYLAAGSAWVAETGSGIAGFAIIDLPARSVWALFVHPQAEGSGIGRALHRTMVGWARDRGVEKLALSTEPGTRAARFYRRAGWTPVGLSEAGELYLELFLPATDREH